MRKKLNRKEHISLEGTARDIDESVNSSSVFFRLSLSFPGE